MLFLPADRIELALFVSTGCLAFAVSISALEYLSILAEFCPGGAFCWRFVEAGIRARGGPPNPRIRAMLGTRPFAVILGVRALAGALLLAVCVLHANRSVFSCGLLACVLMTGAILHYRCTFGIDGGDLMSMIVAAGLLVASIPSTSPWWALVGFGFIAAEACLSYVSSGLAKLTSSQWRGGQPLYRIFRTGTFGHSRAAQLVRRHASLEPILSWSVIIFETAFPLLLLAPRKVLVLGLMSGALFHAANAYVMGLNTFCWAFVATYPALWYCHVQLRIHLLPRLP
jgi:hypothetical protein